MMSEVEKLDAGLEYDFSDPEVDARKLHAVEGCARLNAIPVTDAEERERAVHELLGSAGSDVTVLPVFNCDNGRNIHVGDDFIANYNVTILDKAPVYIGDHVMIRPNTLITTVGHPLSPEKRRHHAAFAKAVTIGDNVVVAAGAVVTKDVPSNSVIAGVPARVVKQIEDDRVQ